MPDSLPALLTLCSRPDIDSVNARLIDKSFVYWLRAEVQSQGFTCKWPCASVIFVLACSMKALMTVEGVFRSSAFTWSQITNSPHTGGWWCRRSHSSDTQAS